MVLSKKDLLHFMSLCFTFDACGYLVAVTSTIQSLETPMKPDAYGLALFVKHCTVVDKNHYFKGNILSQTFGNAFLSRFLFCFCIVSRKSNGHES